MPSNTALTYGAVQPPEARAVAPASSGPGSPPSRWVAVVLTALFGSGLGHVYLGRLRRALLWAAAPFALFAVYTLALALLQLRVLYALFMPFVLGLFLVRGAALLDLFRISPLRSRRAPVWYLPLFWLGSIAYPVFVALLLRIWVVEAFKIPSASMEPSILMQDHVLLDKTSFVRKSPRRGQLAVYVEPEHRDADWLKRMIALPGERLEIRDGHPWINGWQVPHCAVGADVALPAGDEADGGSDLGAIELEFLGDQSYLVFYTGESPAAQGPWLVGPEEVFVLGDNRNKSADSRTSAQGLGGGVPFRDLVGRPLFVWLAFTGDGRVDWPRLNLPLDEPQLPASLKALEPAFRACLASRPAITEPPAAR